MIATGNNRERSYSKGISLPASQVRVASVTGCSVKRYASPRDMIGMPKRTIRSSKPRRYSLKGASLLNASAYWSGRSENPSRIKTIRYSKKEICCKKELRIFSAIHSMISACNDQLTVTHCLDSKTGSVMVTKNAASPIKLSNNSRSTTCRERQK